MFKKLVSNVIIVLIQDIKYEDFRRNPMSKDVIINVKGTQIDTSSDTNTLELITEGKYYQKGNNYYITYKESEVTGMLGTTTTLKVGDGVVTLMRFG